MANERSVSFATPPAPEGGPGEVRRERGLTLEAIAERTKISMRFLRAIESGDFAQLPGGVFAVNYLRQYADSIGMDAKALLARYEQAQEAMRVPVAAQRSWIERVFRAAY